MISTPSCLMAAAEPFAELAFRLRAPGHLRSAPGCQASLSNAQIRAGEAYFQRITAATGDNCLQDRQAPRCRGKNPKGKGKGGEGGCQRMGAGAGRC